MPFYQVKLINSLGKRETRVMEASDEEALKALVRLDKCTYQSSKKLVEKQPNLFFAVSSKVKPSETILFLRQFAVMINASIPIVDAISALRQQRFTPPFMKVLMDVENDILSGKLLSEAFLNHSEVFPNFFCQMVAIGEVSGSLDKVLSSMADYYENDQKIKKKTKAALAYPKLLIFMIFIVVAFLSLYILPKFADMFKEFGGQVPKITQITLSISSFIQTNIKYILTFGLGIFFIIKIFFTTKIGKYTQDHIKLHFPIIGNINSSTIVARFTKAFIILLNSGMTITDCLENLTKILDNDVYKNKFEFAIEEVKRGKRIAKSIENTKLFPAMLTEMINVGENTGNLEEVLSSTAGFYDSQVETSIQRATAALEPIIILILGFVVAVVLLSVYIPMISLMNTI